MRTRLSTTTQYTVVGTPQSIATDLPKAIGLAVAYTNTRHCCTRDDSTAIAMLGVVTTRVLVQHCEPARRTACSVLTSPALFISTLGGVCETCLYLGAK